MNDHVLPIMSDKSKMVFEREHWEMNGGIHAMGLEIWGYEYISLWTDSANICRIINIFWNFSFNTGFLNSENFDGEQYYW